MFVEKPVEFNAETFNILSPYWIVQTLVDEKKGLTRVVIRGMFQPLDINKLNRLGWVQIDECTIEHSTQDRQEKNKGVEKSTKKFPEDVENDSEDVDLDEDKFIMPSKQEVIVYE